MLLLFLIALFGFIALSVPISFSLILTSAVMMISTNGISPSNIAQNVVRGVDSFPLMAIPFFLLAGEIMNVGGLSKRIVQFARSLLGHVPGGLGYVTVVASMLFAGVSGSAVADTTAIGSILYPVMKEEGYDRKKSTALFTASGCIGPIIPPSIPLILYGVIAGVSIVKLFLGGIIPGVCIGLGLMVGWFIHAKRAGYKAEGKFSIVEVFKSTVNAFWALLLPVIILGGIIGGVYTPTEAAVIAVVYAFVVSVFIYKEFDVRKLPKILAASARGTAVVMLICGTATVAAYQITMAQIPQLLESLLLSLAGNSWFLVMFYINILLLLVGCVMDLAPALLIFTPMLVPIVTRVGLSPIYLGVIMTVNLCIGLITPPVGNVLYAGCSVSKLSMSEMSKAIIPNILIMIVVLFIITYIPQLVMLIPNMMH